MKLRNKFFETWLVCAAVLVVVTSRAQPVVKAAAGYGHSLFLKSGGSLWAMGDNSSGEVGDSIYYKGDRPELIVSTE